MSQPSGKKIYIPPYSGVRLIEYRDRLQLVPVPAVRTVYGYGKIKACLALTDSEDPNSEPIWDNLGLDEEVWAVMQWFEYEDGFKEQGDICYLRPEVAEDDVRKRMEQMESFSNMTRQELLDLSQCFEAKEDDYQYIEDNYPNYQSEPDPKNTDEYDLYHARLKVMGELQPKTVALIKIANVTKDPDKRKIAEREAVQSFVAELVHYFTKDEIDAWVRSNPLDISWMRELTTVYDQPRRQIDPINHELALNWLRQKYNHLTAQELRDSVFKRVWRWLAPGFKMTADFIKKRRQLLGLTSKRPSGPRPNSERQ